MFLFYTTDILDNTAFFGEEEARHALQVLRKRPGDTVHFVDGLGGRYEGTITETSKKSFSAAIKSVNNDPDPACTIHLAIAPTKNNDRFEWFLEKATEFGITEITPLLCSNSERRRIRHDRFQKILLSAMKQSLQARLPRLNELISFVDFMEKNETPYAEERYIAHCRSENLPHLKDNYQPKKNVTILIGPEGDFSPEEIERARAIGFLGVSLGDSRLRTETAGIAATHIIKLLNE